MINEQRKVRLDTDGKREERGAAANTEGAGDGFGGSDRYGDVL